MKTMKQLSCEMGQSFVRLATTVMAISLVIWLIVTLTSREMASPSDISTAVKLWPTWLQITAGAVFGGLLFTPANNIATTFWEMVTVQVRRALGAPEPGERPYSQRSLAFANHEQQLRKASLGKLLGMLFRNAFSKDSIKASLPLLLFFEVPIAIASVSAIIYAVVSQAPPEQIYALLIVMGLALISIIIAYFIFLMLPMVVLVAFAIKLYYH